MANLLSRFHLNRYAIGARRRRHPPNKALTKTFNALNLDPRISPTKLTTIRTPPSYSMQHHRTVKFRFHALQNCFCSDSFSKSPIVSNR